MRIVPGGVNRVQIGNGKYQYQPFIQETHGGSLKDGSRWGGYGNYGRTGYSTAPYERNYLSGNDTFVFIRPEQVGQLIPVPATSIMYGVSQEKVPIFSAFSYTWDAIARGTRIVKGELSMVISSPNWLAKLIGNQALPDVDFEKNKNTNSLVIIDENDEQTRRRNLREEFWNIIDYSDIDDIMIRGIESIGGADAAAYPFGREPSRGFSPAEFSGHAPFDIVLCMGDNSSFRSLNYNDWDYNKWLRESYDDYKIMTDINDTQIVSERIVLKNVELMSCGVGIDTSGQPIQETYTFIARDAVTPNVRITDEKQTMRRVGI